MKKIYAIFILFSLLTLSVCAKADKASSEYLKNKKHLAVTNPLVENVAEKIIKKTLKKEVGKGRYKVKFEGYTLSSMKKGVFKNLEIQGKNLDIEGIPIPYLKLRTLSDYNRIDFKENPIKIKTDLHFYYELELDENSIEKALTTKEYQKELEKINQIAYPLFSINEVKIKLKDDKAHIIMNYSLPLSSSKRKKIFMVTTDFKIENGKLVASNVGYDSSYGKIPLNKVTNLINLINPLNFTLNLLKDEKCNGQVENVKIKDNILQINGRIIIKGKDN